MFFVGFFLLSHFLFTATLGGEVPIVDGVFGDVPKDVPQVSGIPEPDTSTVFAPGELRVVENSGVCETTPNVYQASGYGDIATNQSIWFWFFESRKNSDTAPLTLWFNGGPGSSSMVGLFRAHGPCRISNDTRSLWFNRYSWNNDSNVLYIDQPVGVGFSRGDLRVGTSQQAAVDIWKFLQIWFTDSRFSKFRNRPLHLWGESYGGHYVPSFASHILDQNAAIVANRTVGIPINLKSIGIGNGLTDPLSQYPGYLTYAANNPYHPLVNNSTIQRGTTAWTSASGCRTQITSCYNGGSNSVCSAAQSFCNGNVLTPLAGPYNVYFVPMLSNDPYPPDFTNYINSIRARIGAEGTFQITNRAVYSNFASTGDWMRNSRLDLEKIVNAGIRTLIYAGDADYIVNYQGIENMLNAMNTNFTSIWKQQSFSTYNVRGQEAGLFKNAGPMSYLRIYGAGHEVPAYKYKNLDYGEASLQMFLQVAISNVALAST
ncbi:serine carboxypeptidase [Coprinopsis marcescibilis]|uniref:Carboxypeptidase n=1 Tax=Coprinopsis marcescibilis TaxID=230819 RepID=A0A5C3L417_COPMA|nr:serine carboxypeptidase [Coprinopsis marcescibilis]